MRRDANVDVPVRFASDASLAVQGRRGGSQIAAERAPIDKGTSVAGLILSAN